MGRMHRSLQKEEKNLAEEEERKPEERWPIGQFNRDSGFFTTYGRKRRLRIKRGPGEEPGRQR